MNAGPTRLEAIADHVGPADLAFAEQARDRLRLTGDLARLGRLGELAAWWAGVRQEASAGPAQGVAHVRPPLGASGPVGPARDPAPHGVDLDPPTDVAAAVDWGVATADRLADSGTELLLVSAPDAVAARVLAAHLFNLDAVEASGWPGSYGVDDDTWMDDVTAIRDGLRDVRGIRGGPGRPDETLAAIASPVIAAATALLLQAAVRRTPALLDGPGAATAALLGGRLSLHAPAWWQPGHLTEHPLHARCLDWLRLEPLTRLGVAAEDGTGALLGLGVLDVAAGVLTASG